MNIRNPIAKIPHLDSDIDKINFCFPNPRQLTLFIHIALLLEIFSMNINSHELTYKKNMYHISESTTVECHQPETLQS